MQNVILAWLELVTFLGDRAAQEKLEAEADRFDGLYDELTGGAGLMLDTEASSTDRDTFADLATHLRTVGQDAEGYFRHREAWLLRVQELYRAYLAAVKAFEAEQPGVRIQFKTDFSGLQQALSRLSAARTSTGADAINPPA